MENKNTFPAKSDNPQEDMFLSESLEAELNQVLMGKDKPTKKFVENFDDFVIDSDLEKELQEMAIISDQKIDNGEKNILEQIVKQSGIDSQLDELKFESNEKKPQINLSKNRGLKITKYDNPMLDSDLQKEINDSE